MRFEVRSIPGSLSRLARRRPRSVAGLALLAAVALLWQPALLGLAGFMTVRSPLEPAQFILPLYHEADSISEGVVGLYRQQLAPRVVLYRVEPDRLEKLGLVPPAHEFWRALLEACGIPPHAIKTIGPLVEDEVELGGGLWRFARERGPVRAIVMTAAPWTRVSRGALRRGIASAMERKDGDEVSIDLRFHPVTPREIDEEGWWRTRAGWIAYFDASCLWLVRFLR